MSSDMCRRLIIIVLQNIGRLPTSPVSEREGVAELSAKNDDK